MPRRPVTDVNIAIAGLLFDLAHLQTSIHSQRAYKRAARAVLGHDTLIAAGPGATLQKIPYVGPSSERVVREFLATGESATVDSAIARSGKAAEIAALRALRTNFLSNAAAQLLLSQKAPGLVGLKGYRGDLQMHSVWSDGADTLDAMIEAAQARGHTRACMTDHSYGLTIAHGMSMADMTRQHAEIDRLNRAYKGRFRLFKGIEANIRADGTVDMEPDELRRLEIVVASPHSLLRKTFDQTSRMVNAVRQPGIHILGHPRGRMYARPGVKADWDRVFAAAAKSGVAIEIDGDWNRQDLDFALARRALDHGCLLALDSDGHSGSELRYTDCAIAHARLAGATPDRVINYWSDDRLLEWVEQRRA